MNAFPLVLVLVVVGVLIVQREARKLSLEETAALVTAVNAELGNRLIVADVLAVIEIESARDPQAFRAEPQINDASRGLLQVLLSTARDRGYGGPPDGLFDPLTSIRVGMAHLIWTYDYLLYRLNRVPQTGEWIGAYNAGVGNVIGGYIPQGYVQKWAAARERVTARGFG